MTKKKLDYSLKTFKMKIDVIELLQKLKEIGAQCGSEFEVVEVNVSSMEDSKRIEIRTYISTLGWAFEKSVDAALLEMQRRLDELKNKDKEIIIEDGEV